ncbi:MAG: hypothetical protein JXQ75_07825 [Phycisphaerae bacterium]|nr:hypothetical protein [Phycisphaerae bacterium]
MYQNRTYSNVVSRILSRHLSLLVAPLFLGVAAVLAQDYGIDWHTVDGGGKMWSIGGDYELGGTIGQPDAGVMTGGTYALTGGFWAVPPCWCLADINNDGRCNGQDVQAFVDCFLATGTNCACADLATDGVLDMNDVTAFVADLLSGAGCP